MVMVLKTLLSVHWQTRLQIRDVLENSGWCSGSSGSCLLCFQETKKTLAAPQMKLYFDVCQLDKKFNYMPIVRERTFSKFYNTYKLE